MTDKLREKAQQALGALEAAGYGNSYAAIELREALAEQAEQEPVVMDEAWCLEPQPVNGLLSNEQVEQEPVAWVWLDDWLNDGYAEDCFSRVNHQNKTPLYAAPQPMSVRHVRRWEFNKDIGAWFLAYTFNPKAKTRPLVFGDAAPVQQVDLTDAEIADIGTNCGTSMWSLMFARAVIAAYKEKNK